MNKKGENKVFVFLVFYRWLTWTNVLILHWAGAKFSVFLPIFLVFLYNLLFSVFPKSIKKTIEKRPFLLLIDLIFCAFILQITGGWASPFYIYCFSPLLIAALLFKFRGAIYSASVFSFLYISVLYLNGYSVARIAEMGRLDSLISNFICFFLIAIFFAYPSRLLEELEKSRQETKFVKDNLDEAHKKLEITYKLSPLSEREIEVLYLLAEGKSNKEIAGKLFLSESTVKTHISNIYKKLNLQSRTEAVAYFFKENNPSE